MSTRQRSVTHGNFTLRRTYPHPPDRVYAAFGEPEAIRAWLVEGEGWEVESFDMDFRVGGLQNSSFRYQGGPLIHNHTVYQDIVPGERIVYAYRMTVEGECISASLASVEFRTVEGGTELVLTEQDAFLDGHDGLESRKGGTDGLLDALGDWLDANPAD